MCVLHYPWPYYVLIYNTNPVNRLILMPHGIRYAIIDSLIFWYSQYNASTFAVTLTSQGRWNWFQLCMYISDYVNFNSIEQMAGMKPMKAHCIMGPRKFYIKTVHLEKDKLKINGRPVCSHPCKVNHRYSFFVMVTPEHIFLSGLQYSNSRDPAACCWQRGSSSFHRKNDR